MSELGKRQRKPATRFVEQDQEFDTKKASPKKARPAAGAKGAKKKKDPNAPKRPLSSFLLFTADHRADVARQNPDMKVSDVARVLGAMWQESADKKHYEKLAAKNKAAYEKELARWQAENEAN
mmetsp:Transcript_17889/g.42151  ORF Transcript_17889/g.42151 Transcript_17889/m.42151 type:complete len:123 (-) Transcript_17889:86-454(-)|eukprot:CAMPEP_0114557714 /NCGR_PEP_ID=MMETSP0114-20121206/9982_1 /TAXON_ID=31324 /ORGANISM="Goniomonas sp, Strain m" /LENGTH=122 /DNA_ID=CAMNT_0001743029 /DNA_START=46 /DNA_END=414 /DNA_ORIENTATION=-